MVILIVASVPLLSIATICLFKQGILPNANALLPQIDADSLPDDRLNKEEMKELFGQSASSFRGPSPVVGVILGEQPLHELVTIMIVIAMCVILAGVCTNGHNNT